MFQVHHQELQRDDALGCLFQACHDPAQAVSALAYTEFAFNCVTVSYSAPYCQDSSLKKIS